jgi:RNA polymerase sporulation-specific sigma factor
MDMPKVLNTTSERELLLKFEMGDEEAKNTLIEHNLRLVVHKVKKFKSTGIDFEDLISIGTIGLIKGINTFKLEKNIKLSTYTARCIQNEILKYLRSNNKTKLEISIDKPISSNCDENELFLSDILGTENDIVSKDMDREIENQLLNIAMNILTERERQIIEMRFGIRNENRMTFREISNAIGLNHNYTCALAKKILLKLRKELDKGY